VRSAPVIDFLQPLTSAPQDSSGSRNSHSGGDDGGDGQPTATAASENGSNRGQEGGNGSGAQRTRSSRLSQQG
jgi:hypothetical protein